MLKSCQSETSQRPAIGSSVWLDVRRSTAVLWELDVADAFPRTITPATERHDRGITSFGFRFLAFPARKPRIICKSVLCDRMLRDTRSEKMNMDVRRRVPVRIGARPYGRKRIVSLFI